MCMYVSKKCWLRFGSILYSPDYGVHSLYDGVDLGNGVREEELVGPHSAIGLLEDSLQPIHQDAQGMARSVERLRRK